MEGTTSFLHSGLFWRILRRSKAFARLSLFKQAVKSTVGEAVVFIRCVTTVILFLVVCAPYYCNGSSSDDVDKNGDSLIVCEGNLSKNKVNVQDTAADQLFSPTTKKTLEEINDMSSRDESTSNLSPKMKRPLFSLKESQVSTETSVKAAIQNVSSQLNVDTVEKPLRVQLRLIRAPQMLLEKK